MTSITEAEENAMLETSNDQHLIEAALTEGFAGAAVIHTDQIPFDFSFRTYCAENLCGQYGANYTCPPDCGSCDQMRQRLLSHRKALGLQTIWEISDYTDNAAIKDAKRAHNGASIALMKKLRAAGVPGFLVGVSGCALCDRCAAQTGDPCRFPDLRYSCMSAYCIFVSKLCEKCGLEYDCGPGLLGFFGMYVFD